MAKLHTRSTRGAPRRRGLLLELPGLRADICEELDIQLNDIPTGTAAPPRSATPRGELPRLVLSAATSRCRSSTTRPGDRRDLRRCWLSTREAKERFEHDQACSPRPTGARRGRPEAEERDAIKHMPRCWSRMSATMRSSQGEEAARGIKIAGYVGCQTNGRSASRASRSRTRCTSKAGGHLGADSVHVREEGAVLRRRAAFSEPAKSQEMIRGSSSGYDHGADMIVTPARVSDERRGLPGPDQRDLRTKFRCGRLLLDADAVASPVGKDAALTASDPGKKLEEIAAK